MTDEIKKITNKIITEMLTESTGKAFMDSGDIYGRHWEENQKNGILTGGQPVYWGVDEDNKKYSISSSIPIFGHNPCFSRILFAMQAEYYKQQADKKSQSLF